MRPYCGYGVFVSALALAVAAASGLEACRPAPPATLAPRQTSCSTLPATADSIEYPVYAQLTTPALTRYDANGKPQTDMAGSPFATMMLRAIRQGFVTPAPLGLNVYQVRGEPGSAPFASLAIFGEVTFTLAPSGAITTAHVTQTSLSPALDQSLLDALHRADSAERFLWNFESTGAPARLFHLTITNESVQASRGFLLFTIRAPLWHTMTDPADDKHHPMPAPIYPPDLRQSGFQATLYTQFAIDEFGDPVMSTFRLIGVAPSWFSQPIHADPSSRDMQLSPFVWAAEQATRNAHYVPATIAGCPVKMLVYHTFKFTSPEPH